MANQQPPLNSTHRVPAGFTGTASSTPHSNPTRWMLWLTLACRWCNWGIKRLPTCPRSHHCEVLKLELWPSGSKTCALNHSATLPWIRKTYLIDHHVLGTVGSAQYILSPLILTTLWGLCCFYSNFFRVGNEVTELKLCSHVPAELVVGKTRDTGRGAPCPAPAIAGDISHPCHSTFPAQQDFISFTWCPL